MVAPPHTRGGQASSPSRRPRHRSARAATADASSPIRLDSARRRDIQPSPMRSPMSWRAARDRSNQSAARSSRGRERDVTERRERVRFELTFAAVAAEGQALLENRPRLVRPIEAGQTGTETIEDHRFVAPSAAAPNAAPAPTRSAAAPRRSCPAPIRGCRARCESSLRAAAHRSSRPARAPTRMRESPRLLLSNVSCAPGLRALRARLANRRAGAAASGRRCQASAAASGELRSRI